MGSFLLLEIKNTIRLDGYLVTKHTNRRVICDLLELKKDSTLSDICEKLKIIYIKREGDFEYKASKKIFLHYLDKETTISYESLNEASKSLGIYLLYETTKLEKNVLEKIFFVGGEKAVLSFHETIDRKQNFQRCMMNKININLALMEKLGYTIDYDISIPEIFSELNEKIPNNNLKERLCQLLEIPHFFEKNSGGTGKRKVVAKSQNEILYFNSMVEAAEFFEQNSGQIRKIIDLNYRIPFWFKRYKLEFV